MRGALFVSLFLCFTSAIFILLILVAGTNKNILVDWFFLKTSTASLKLPSALSNSTFLKDLGTISGADLVGQDVSASTLGLAETYTISLFSSCSSNSTTEDKSTKCTSTRFGYEFNPLSDLKLSSTSMSSSMTSSWKDSTSYGPLSRFISIAYIFALLLSIGTFASNILSCCTARAAIISVIFSTAATICTFAASVTSLAVFTRVKAKYNDQLSAAGIETSIGNRLFIVSWIAFGLLFANSVLLCIQHRKSSNERKRKRSSRRSGGISVLAGKAGTEESTHEFAKPKRTKTLQLLKQIPTPWNRHKYSQIGEQARKRKQVFETGKDDRESLTKRGFGGGEDEFDGHDDDDREYGSGERTMGGRRGQSIPLVEVTSAKPGDSTAYEPFRHTQVKK